MPQFSYINVWRDLNFVCLAVVCNTICVFYSLGSLHDGENNACDPNNRFIMSSSENTNNMSPDKRTNQWHFSACSVNYFREFLANSNRYLMKFILQHSVCLNFYACFVYMVTIKKQIPLLARNFWFFQKRYSMFFKQSTRAPPLVDGTPGTALLAWWSV